MQPGERRGDVDLLDYFPPTVTILEGIREAVSEATEIRVARGCEVAGKETAGIAEAVAAARGADAAIVVVGGRSGLSQGCTSGEANDRADVSLPGVQAELVAAVAETGVPTVLVLVNGRPLALTNVVDRVCRRSWRRGSRARRAAAPWPTSSSAPPRRAVACP